MSEPEAEAWSVARACLALAVIAAGVLTALVWVLGEMVT
jgi:hypothetical protein